MTDKPTIDSKLEQVLVKLVDFYEEQGDLNGINQEDETEMLKNINTSIKSLFKELIGEMEIVDKELLDGTFDSLVYLRDIQICNQLKKELLEKL